VELKLRNDYLIDDAIELKTEKIICRHFHIKTTIIFEPQNISESMAANIRQNIGCVP
jgi:hypothetical protein